MIRFAENLNKMITAGLGGALEAPSTEVAVGHRVRYMDASGPVATFNTNITALIRSLRVDVQLIQEGSGDPSPDNIRPITGRDSVTVVRTGGNVFGGDALKADVLANVSKATDASDDAVSVGTHGTGALSFGAFKANTQYTIILDVLPGGTYLGTSFEYTDGTKKTAGMGYTANTRSAKAYTSDANKTIDHIVLSKAMSAYTIYCNTSGIFEGVLTAADFEPYDGASVTVQLGQTVYGGTVDVTGGKVRVTDAIFTLDGSENDWYLQTVKDTGTIYRTYALKTKGIAEFSKANYCTTYTAAIANMPVNTVKFLPSTEGAYVCLAQSTLADFKAFLSANPLQIDCKLAEPFDIDIDPATLSTLKGDNTVWSDAGDVTLEYPYYEETEGY